MKRALILAAAGVALIVAAGRGTDGKLLYAIGLPGPAAALIDDPAARGTALWRAGDYAGADAAFAQAGRTATFNRGTSLAMLGDYGLARAYFDAVLFANPADSQARENRALVDRLAPKTLGEGNAAGRIAARAKPGGGPPVELFSAVARPLDPGRIVPDDDWLATLPDDPGAFLRLRLADEYQRRLAMGFTPPEAGDPW
ncbi:hypothetical protein V8J36_02500 [Frigidibacter sp. MR17.14]|uniref:hypothetical protein n=1 Tax=Frigidibacter sp. MR17.14 TaxID=3126509 RepID=UPI0030130677